MTLPMSERNEVRVSDQDGEMLAIKAISAAMDRLDVETCERVIRWAEDRYVRTAIRAIGKQAMEGIKAQMETLDSEAKMLGVSVPQLIHTFSAIRSKHQLAPIEDTTPKAAADIEAAERRLAEAQ